MADMTPAAFLVLQGFANLSFEERVEVLGKMNYYQDNVSNAKRTALLENTKKIAGVSLGPTNSNGCPCCGK